MCYFLTDFLNCFNVKELYQLKLTCKQFNESISKERLDKLIVKQMNEDLQFNQEIVDFLRSTNAFISGSFIVQSILNEYYQDSDIDIYLPIKDDADIKINYEFTNFDVIYDTDKYETDFWDGNLLIHRVVSYRLMPSLERRFTISSLTDKIDRLQIIYIKINNDHQSIINYLAEYFDFDICKNYYQPNKIYIHKLNQINI